jgi:hypothetical protein
LAGQPRLLRFPIDEIHWQDPNASATIRAHA